MKTKEGSRTAVDEGHGAHTEHEVCSSGETGDGRVETEKPTSSKQPATEDDCSATDVSLDDQLEAKAQRKNLSVTNVKSILHHLVKDKRVFKLVQRLAARGEGEGEGEGGEAGSSRQAAEDWDELTAYEPRLTRSRVRQAVMSAVATGNLSTDKLAVVNPRSSSMPDASIANTATNDTESSDEEYNPDNSSGDEEEEEEMEEEEGQEMEQDAEMVNEEDVDEIVEGVSRESEDRETAHDDSEVPQPHSSVECRSPCTPTPLNSRQATPTSSLTTPTRTPPREQTEMSSSTVQEENQEIHETALLLASLADTHNTLSPLKYLTQQSATVASDRDTGIRCVSGVSTDPTTQQSSTSGDTVINSVPCVSTVQDQSVGSCDTSNNIVSNVSAADSANGREKDSVTCQFGSSNPDVNVTNTASEEEIAKRTRSKHPLHDVSISSLEAGLGPVEGEDPPTPRELDPDELWWHQWLNSLTTDPLNDSLTSHAVEEEEEEDGEYNFLADCLREEEREEFRNDRAVRIPQREVDDLITELLNPSVEVSGGRLLSTDGVDLIGAYLLETLGVQIPTLTQTTVTNVSVTTSAPQLALADDPASSPTASTAALTASSGCVLSKDQTLQLWTQIQQHFQLLMQTFVLARFEPSLVFVSQVAAQALDELSRWCSPSRDSVAEGGQSLWYIPDMQDGLDLVKTLDPYDDTAVKISPSTGTPPKVPEGAQKVFMDTMLFWNHPHLLPASGFTPLTTNSASVSKYFTREEECLLVLGMEHYGSSAWQEIQKNLLPTKTIKQLKLRVKNRCSKRSGNNVIKEYKKAKEIPQISDEQQPELPQWIIIRDKKMAIREKEEVNKKQKQIDEVRKILCSASRVAASMATELSLAPKTDTIPSTIMSSNDSITCALSQDDTTTSTAATLPGIKRLCDETETSVPVKRARVTTPKARKARGRKALRQASPSGSAVAENTECAASRASLEHLLVAAGVEPSDPMARFSFKFLREVKNVGSDSEPSIYNQFIQLLEQHCQHHWRPCQLFERVRQLLKLWPHLVSLFTEFLSPQDCLEANVLQERQDVQNVKSFLSKLQSQFSSSPLQLREITDKLKQLDTPSVTRQQVCDALLPLMEVHRDLSEELGRFIFHLAPSPRNGECYEEITLCGDDDDKHPDGFEQVTSLSITNATSGGST